MLEKDAPVKDENNLLATCKYVFTVSVVTVFV